MGMTKTQIETVFALAGISSLPSTWTPLNKEILYFVTDNDDNPISVNPKETRFRFVGETMDVLKVRQVKDEPVVGLGDQFDGKYYEYHNFNGDLQYDTYFLEDIYFIALNLKGDLV